MGRNNRRTRAVVDIDDLIIRADNIVVVGDRNSPVRNGRVAGIQDDDDMENVEVKRHNYYQDGVLGISEEIHYYGPNRIDF
ncbi:hypothetical protein OEV98_13415 [Caldibacillus lycopersici]|uniref:Uncharacterized protein n=1 Tax=Perspicuibacillus lycopersici TaxID=1325689 RepID=A0AAE3IUP5_9BACI|nr:hypothetical protein [Perspicuibacillus lycopersici]MCU9614537.1 hypothetical protein [Perspicuibacillus lycopersici]